MGKISRWFQSIISPTTATPQSKSGAKPSKRRWSFVKSKRENIYVNLRPNADEHTVGMAIPVVATAATTVMHVSQCCVGSREELAAVKIQSSFRGYLSRRALKALKALVKVQALAKGYLQRRKVTLEMQRRQSLLRAQARARAKRLSQFSTSISSPLLHPGPATPEKFDYVSSVTTRNHDYLSMLKKNTSKSNTTLEGLFVEQGYPYSARAYSTDKILEVDSGKLHSTDKQRCLFQSPYHTSPITSAFHQTFSSPSYETKPFNPLDSNSHRGPFTPSKSDGSSSGPNGFYDHPNYLTCTESSRAKMRSMSAPRQRVVPRIERSGSTANKYPIYVELRSSCSGSITSNKERVYGLNSDKFSATKAYPGSGRLDRLGMPVGGDADSAIGPSWNRY